VNKSECTIDFRQINIKYFELNTSVRSLEFSDTAKFAKTIISDKAYIIEFHEETQILSLPKNIFYVLHFENNLLVGYNFKIPVDENKLGKQFYYDILKKVDKTKNDFIQKREQLSYMKTTKSCKRFFRFTGNEIFGGIQKSQ
jgi:hypothetical protein